jgi:omega-6 fatty acid desaturase (delta-12 desaturase)
MYVVSVICSYSINLAVFHNQHTFNPPYVTNKHWTKENSGLKGSSFIQLPNWLSFFFYGDEYHHVHHMLASIPPYHLRDAHEYLVTNEPAFKDIIQLSMTDCYHNLWLTLYDEEDDRYISFREADEKIQQTSNKQTTKQA